MSQWGKALTSTSQMREDGRAATGMLASLHHACAHFISGVRTREDIIRTVSEHGPDNDTAWTLGQAVQGTYMYALWLSWVFPFIRWWAFDAFVHCWLLVKLSELSCSYDLYNGNHGKYQDCYGIKFLGLNPWRKSTIPKDRQSPL